MAEVEGYDPPTVDSETTVIPISPHLIKMEPIVGTNPQPPGYEPGALP